MASAGDSRAAEEVVKEHEEQAQGTHLRALREDSLLPVHPHIEKMCKSTFKRLPMCKKEKSKNHSNIFMPFPSTQTYLCCFLTEIRTSETIKAPKQERMISSFSIDNAEITC